MENEAKRLGRPPKSALAVEPAEAGMVNVKVNRDFWNDQGRVKAGTIISVPVQDALKGVKNGSLDPVED